MFSDETVPLSLTTAQEPVPVLHDAVLEQLVRAAQQPATPAVRVRHSGTAVALCDASLKYCSSP
jgi:hypothetical protein